MPKPGRFHKTIRGRKSISVIAELKRRSPSHGAFPRHEVSALMKAYEAGGATALSVVTDTKLFDGSLALLREMKKHTLLPILRKDFIRKKTQIEETAKSGASAVLLIARLLSETQLRKLIFSALSAGLDPIVEIHTPEDLTKISRLDASNVIIGINNRNLEDFQTNIAHAQSLVDLVPKNFTIIAESGFGHPSELEPYAGKIDAVLIGSSLLISPNPQKTLTTFTHARRSR